jgi:hypothetical protein
MYTKGEKYKMFEKEGEKECECGEPSTERKMSLFGWTKETIDAIS